jgi:hypothetical protein
MNGIAMLRAIQSISSPALDAFFYAVTQLHHETFYMLVLPMLLWFIDKRFARYMVSVFLLGYWANNLLKDLFHTARPTPDQVRQVHPETGTGYAFPSGHAMNPLMFWGALALRYRRTGFTLFVAGLVFLIGFSRLYLGVHWPLDVLGGWVIGGLMLYLFEQTRPFFAGENRSLLVNLAWAFVIPLGTLGLSALVTPDALPKDVWVTSGAYLGFWVGSVIEERFVGFDPRVGSPARQLLKLLIGIVLVLAVKEGAKLILPATGVGDLIRYCLVALTAACGAPWVFTRLVSPPPSMRIERPIA